MPVVAVVMLRCCCVVVGGRRRPPPTLKWFSSSVCADRDRCLKGMDRCRTWKRGKVGVDYRDAAS